jgi:hypothetical protein
MAAVAIAAAPNGAAGHGADVSAVAKAVHTTQGNAHGKAVSAIASAHGKEVSAAARARAAANKAAGQANGAAGKANGQANKANGAGHGKGAGRATHRLTQHRPARPCQDSVRRLTGYSSQAAGATPRA